MATLTPEKRIRMQAKEKLQDKWTAMAGAFFTVAVFVMIALYLADTVDLIVNTVFEAYDLFRFFGEDVESTGGLVAMVLYVPAILLIFPVFIGFLRFIYLTVKDEETSFADIFYYMGKRYGNAFNRIFYVFTHCLGRIIVSFLPAGLAFSAVYYFTYDKEELAFFDVICYVIVYALLFAGLMLCLSLCRKYFLCFFLYIDDESLSPQEMCHRSEAYLYPLGNSVTKLYMTVFPLILSCILVIPCIFVVPYITATLSTSAKWIIALYEVGSGNKDE